MGFFLREEGNNFLYMNEINA